MTPDGSTSLLYIALCNATRKSYLVWLGLFLPQAEHRRQTPDQLYYTNLTPVVTYVCFSTPIIDISSFLGASVITQL